MRRALAVACVTFAALSAVASAARADGPGFAHQTTAPILLSSDSRDGAPAVAIDTNGTAYIVWLRSDSSGSSVQYCRLPRGHTTCDVSKFFTGPSASDDLSEANVFLEGPGKPDVVYTQTTTGNPMFIRKSTDGGATFTARTAFGDGFPDSVVAGPGSSVSMTHGAGYYGFEYGDYPLSTGTSRVYLDGTHPGDPDPLVDGGVGLVDSTTPIAAYSDGGSSYWRVYDATHGANYNTPSFWKPTTRMTMPGEPQARLTSGVDGVFLQTLAQGNTDGAHYVVRHYNGVAANTFGGPTTPSDTTGGVGYGQLSEDGGGGLHSAWWDNQVTGGGFADPIRYAYSPDGGQTWYRRTLEDAPSEVPRQLQMAAAPDGGGLVVHDRLDSGGVVVDVIPTPNSPGLDPPPPPPPGPGADTSTPPPGIPQPVITPPAACQTIAATTTVSARTSVGCWKSVGAAKTTTADVRVNGIDFVNPGKTITVDPAAHTLVIPAGVTAKAGAIVLHDGNDPGFTWDFDKPTAFPDIGKAGINLLGFPVTGDGSVKFGSQTAAVTVNIALKPPFSQVSASPVLQTSMDKNLQLEGLSFDIAHVSVGPLLDIDGIHIAYTGKGSVFEGSAAVSLPTDSGASGGFTAKIGFADGDITHLDLAYSGPPLPLYIAPPAIFLNEIDFGLQNHSSGLSVTGGVSFSGGPKLFGVAAIQVDGGLTLTIPTTGPVTLTAAGKLKIANIPFGNASLMFSTAGKVSFSGGFDIDALEPIIGISVSESGFIGVSPPSFEADAHAEVSIPAHCGAICLSGSADGVISSKGFGVCGSVGLGPVSVSAGVIWPWATGPDPYLTGCQSSLKDVKLDAPGAPPAGTPPPAPGQGAPTTVLTGPQTIAVPAGTDQFDAVVQGAGGVPNVTVTGPGGRTITVGPDNVQSPVTGPNDMVGFATPVMTPAGYPAKPAAAVVLIPKPPAGTYTITPNAGSVPIIAVLDAKGTPLPTTSGGSVSSTRSVAAGAATAAAVKASPSRRRVVHFSLGPLHGHTVTVAEQGPGIDHPLGTAHVGQNRIAFTVADGPAGVRQVVVLIANDTGVATAKRVVGTFVAPGPIRPGRAHVTLSRTKTGGVAVRWKKVASAQRYDVQVTLADGRRLQYATKRLGIAVPAVAAAVTGKVSVTALRGSVVGKPSSVTLKKVTTKKAKKVTKKKTHRSRTMPAGAVAESG